MKRLPALDSLNAAEIETALRALPVNSVLEVNGRLVVRKRRRDGRVGRDEWDVDGERKLLAAALALVLPAGRSLLRG